MSSDALSRFNTREILQLLTQYLNINHIWIQSLVYIVLLLILYPIEKVALPYVVSTCIVKWQKGQSINTMYHACKWFFLFFLMIAIIWSILYFLGLNVQQHIGVDVREAMVKQLFKRYEMDQKEIALGEMNTHLNSVPWIFEQLFYKIVCYILPESIGLLVVAGYLTYVNVWLGVGSFVFLIMCVVYFSLFIHKSQHLAKNEYKQQTQFHQNTHNIVDNMAYIQTSQSESYELKRFEDQCKNYYQTRSLFCTQNTAFIFGFYVLKMCYIFFVVYLMYTCMTSKTVTVEQIVLYGSVFVILLSEEKDIDYVFKLVTELYNHTSKASVMLDNQSSTPKPSTHHAHVVSHQPVTQDVHSSSHTRLPSSTALHVQNLHFVHPESSISVVKNKTLSFECRRLHAIVGSSGSGKTTFAKLVSGIHSRPQSGHIFIHGKDCTDDAHTRRKKVMYLPQHVKLFEGSILDNIRYTHETMTHASVHRILNQFGVSDLLKGNAKSSTYLHRQVGIDGSGVSGGQKQIIILMRTYIDTVGKQKNSTYTEGKSVLILDEPTASLDDHMVDVVMNLLQRLKNTHTIIMITHNRYIAKQCDSFMQF